MNRKSPGSSKNKAYIRKLNKRVYAMCCRYYMEMSPELRPIVEAAERSKLRENNLNWLSKGLITQGEIYPDNLVPVIATGKSGGKKVFPMVWGYHMEGLNRPIINARSETAMAKKTFRESWMNHRCIVPASWYYEWAHHLRPDEKKKILARNMPSCRKDRSSPGSAGSIGWKTIIRIS